jgi:Fe2+ transport system protein B
VFPPATPFTAHPTAVFAVPVTVAVYCENAPSSTLLAPLIVIVSGDGVAAGAATSVTVTLCDVAMLFALVAVILTLEDAGIVAGAL